MEELFSYAPRIAFRDVTRATDSRTVRITMLPPQVLINHLAPYLPFPRGDHADTMYLLGILSSLPVDWYARRFVETHLTFFVLAPFPIPRPSRDNPLWRRTVELAGRLAAPDERFRGWADAVGVECGELPGDVKFAMISELDAVVAHLYRLEERHLRHIFETFHETWQPGATADHPTLGNFNERWELTRGYFRAWGKSKK